MKVVLTGGHLSPALAVIEKLKKDEVFFIGRKNTFEGDNAVSLEYAEITKLNIPFFSLTSSRLQRTLTKHTFISLSKLPVGFYQAIKILRKINPDVVLGFGGYVSLPVILAAYSLKVPVVIHEQTFQAGFANKIASKFAKKICISWDSSHAFFSKDKTVLTGNPLRKNVIDIKNTKKTKNKVPLIYITGGSAGSHAINLYVEQNLEKLLEKYKVIHQTGDSKEYSDYNRLEEKKKALPEFLSKNYTLIKFVSPHKAAEFINAADLVVGRAGINTVTELIYLEKPAFLIPLESGQRNEQLKNARFLKSAGLGEFSLQSVLTDDEFIYIIDKMLNNLEDYKIANKFFVLNAAERIVEVLRNVSEKKAA